MIGAFRFPQSFTDPEGRGFAAFEINPGLGRKRIFLISFRGAGMPLAYPEPEPRTHSWRDFEDAVDDLLEPSAFDAASRRIAAVEDHVEPAAYSARPVRGQVVRDASGRLFEAQGHTLRPLGRLVRGPRGEMFELLPAPAPLPPAVQSDSSVVEGELMDSPSADASIYEPANPPAAAATHPAPASDGPMFRQLFALPGLPRIVALGDFRSSLASQIRQPQRLRDTHRLSCYLQVYECRQPQRVDLLYDGMRSRSASPAPFEPLTEDAAALLGLDAYLARRPRPRYDRPVPAGFVRPFERFFQLQLAQDPTANLAPAAGVAQPTAPPGAGASATSAPPPAQQGPVAQQPAASEVQAAQRPVSSEEKAAPARKKDIPAAYATPGEFQLTREEALFGLRTGGPQRGFLRALFGGLTRRLQRNREFRKWTTLLAGKNFDDQLWAVRPPREAWNDPVVRSWARQTLHAAGYDAENMMLEWEIYWRRRGVV